MTLEPLDPNVCLFCGSSPAIPAEPVWPAWIRKRLEPTGSAALRQPMKDVCESCLSGWMRRLEESAVPILETQALDGGSRQWTRGDQRTLAAWAIKTAMVLELAAPAEGGPFFTDNERWLFMNMLEPPLNDTKVWAAAYRGERPVHYHHARIALRHGAAASHVGDAFVVTLSAGHIAFQMAARRFFEPRRFIDDIAFPSESTEWQRAAVPVWPPADPPRQWPPPLALDTPGLEAFGARWNEQMNAGM